MFEESGSKQMGSELTLHPATPEVTRLSVFANFCNMVTSGGRDLSKVKDWLENSLLPGQDIFLPNSAIVIFASIGK